MSREAGCTAGPCMYRDRYFEIERLLDGVLGTEDSDGAGEGIVSDVRLAIAEAEKRGAVKLLDYLMRQHADSMAIVQLDLAGLWDRFVTGEVTL